MKTRLLALRQSGIAADPSGVSRRVVVFESADGETAGFELAISEVFDDLEIGAEYDVEFRLAASAEEVASRSTDQPRVDLHAPLAQAPAEDNPEATVPVPQADTPASTSTVATENGTPSNGDPHTD